MSRIGPRYDCLLSRLLHRHRERLVTSPLHPEMDGTPTDYKGKSQKSVGLAATIKSLSNTTGSATRAWIEKLTECLKKGDQEDVEELLDKETVVVAQENQSATINVASHQPDQLIGTDEVQLTGTVDRHLSKISESPSCISSQDMVAAGFDFAA